VEWKVDPWDVLDISKDKRKVPPIPSQNQSSTSQGRRLMLKSWILEARHLNIVSKSMVYEIDYITYMQWRHGDF